MSIFGSVLKVAGTIVEGAGKTIKDCVEAVEQDTKEYKQSSSYKRAEAERAVIRAELKDNWNKIKSNAKNYYDTYNK